MRSESTNPGTKLCTTLALLAIAPIVPGTPPAARTQTAEGRPLVQTVEGPVLGVEREGVNVFTAIPYAAPPVGPLRFRAPQPHAHWTQPLEANRETPACPQTAGAAIGKPSEDEDCLFLSVWAPAGPASGKRTVMLWIHGSGEKGYGGSPFFDGFWLAHDNGVIVITINYRLGLLGSLVSPFLDSPNDQFQSGNYHLLDQQEALRWVQRNAERFGGDPGGVTVFGESAGGGAVLALLASPASKGLFQRAIVESGAGSRLISRTHAEQLTREKFLPMLGCEDAKDVAACLRTAPVSAFLKASDGYLYAGDARLLPLDPFVAFQRGAFLRVPVLIGSNADEGHFYSALFESMRGRRMTEEDYQADIRLLGNYPGLPPGLSNGSALKLYPTRSFSSAAAAASRLVTDLLFACDAERARRSISRFTTVYGYEFGEPDPVQEEPLAPITELPNAAYHTSEEAYIFNGGHDHAPLTGRSVALSVTMRGYWTSFARTGDPNGSGRIEWPRFSEKSPEILRLQQIPKVTRRFADDHNCTQLEAAGFLGTD